MRDIVWVGSTLDDLSSFAPKVKRVMGLALHQAQAEAGVEQIPYTVSSGNVFADLGVDEPAETLLKADLARQIGRIIRDRGLSQTAAARLLGVDQPKVSALLRGRLSGFSIDRLVRYLTALDQEVELVVRPRERCASQETGEKMAIPPRQHLAVRARVPLRDHG